MNERVNLIIETLKELNGEGFFEDIYSRIGINFSTESEFSETIFKMVKNGIIDKLDSSKVLRLRAGLDGNEKRYIDVRFTIDEAIILFDFLNRVNEKDITPIIKDEAEQYVLWKLEGFLERKMVEPFQPEYDQIVKVARGRMRNFE